MWLSSHHLSLPTLRKLRTSLIRSGERAKQLDRILSVHFSHQDGSIEGITVGNNSGWDTNITKIGKI
jgi:hypothetical protein